ncbi:hypothetical protein IFU04_22345 [Pseudomonas syringae]|nr:hypothetical protein [Pseudomonas syringae]
MLKIVVVTVSLSVALISLASCWSFAPNTPYGQGFQAGCDSAQRYLPVESRDSNARTLLQAEYYKGWNQGFRKCKQGTSLMSPPFDKNGTPIFKKK